MTPLFSRRFLSQAGLVAGAILFSAALQTQAAFTQPNTAPPRADVYTLLDTGSATQTKQGGINAANSTFTRIGTNGYSPISGYPTGWGGGIHTFDMFAEGTIGAGTSGVMKAGFNRDGNAWFNGTTHLSTACFGTDCITAWPQGQGNVTKGSAVYKCPGRSKGQGTWCGGPGGPDPYVCNDNIITRDKCNYTFYINDGSGAMVCRLFTKPCDKAGYFAN